MKSIFLVFPHQLFEDVSLLKGKRVLLIEHPLYFYDKKVKYKMHIQKLILHRLAMQKYYDYLKSKDIDCKYIKYSLDFDFEEILNGYKEIEYYYLADFFLEKRLFKIAKNLNISVQEHQSFMFLNSVLEIREYFSKKKFQQTPFYIAQRKKMNILLDTDGKPLEGRWTFDVFNRKKLPKGLVPPNLPEFEYQDFTKVVESLKDVPSRGEFEEFNYPVDFDQAKIMLEDFLKKRFLDFGPYEDAISKEHVFNFHSVLSSSLNCGLLTPKFVVERALEFADKHKVPIESLEGFIRQIIGWREFMHAAYLIKGVEIRNGNFFKAKSKLPNSFYDGTTGIFPLDMSIKRALKYAYCHHIERLMVLGNFMCLMEIDPNQIYQWFLELFIDGYDWVMVANVYSMSQYADGGLLTTKPYISSSNYVLKMSDYKKGDWCEVWDALYWHFINKHRDFFASNPRLNLMVKMYDKKQDSVKVKMDLVYKNFKNE